MRKVLAFCVIVLLHAAVVVGIAFVRRDFSPVLVQSPVSVRFIAADQREPAKTPVELKIRVPNLTIPLPEVPIVEIPVIQQESDRAITIPVRAAVPVASTETSRVPKLISTVEYLREPMPRYPPQSRKLREQGLVMLRVLIDEHGVASSIEIETSSGYARLDHAAREAVLRAAFRPYVEDGAPRRAMVLIPIEFSLNRNSA